MPSEPTQTCQCISNTCFDIIFFLMEVLYHINCCANFGSWASPKKKKKKKKNFGMVSFHLLHE
ncbi:hypothetical protein CROQUDRAFT_690044 [Cronartium quercuum f. sp. fusiforme G11]|uniref:Uncharacterized protein n=1 Tax=Cronartium quercuum f. sp. fusiforme G11 TaxID=708437 RepID=A0A9P6TER0_9BASI|nr:hypothetical protein CROQUDRAFT_690044 [Cronartium quercuum f. sp. fusiforme G11]